MEEILVDNLFTVEATPYKPPPLKKGENPPFPVVGASKENPYCLANLDKYDDNGVLISTAKLEDYIGWFAYELQQSFPPARIRKYLDYQYERTGNKQHFLEHMEYVLNSSVQRNINEFRIKLITNWIGEKEKELMSVKDNTPPMVIEKIKWLGKAELFNYVFGILLEKGYLDVPTSETVGSRAKLAKLLLLHFDVKSGKGKTKGQQAKSQSVSKGLDANNPRLSTATQQKLDYLKKLPHLNELD